MRAKTEEVDAYFALNNAIIAFQYCSWCAACLFPDFKRASKTMYFKKWYESLSEEQKKIADYIVQRTQSNKR